MLFSATYCYYCNNINTTTEKNKRKIKKNNAILIGYHQSTFYESINIDAERSN